MLGHFVDKFETFFRVRTDSNGNQKVDPSMYLGSSGYAYALHRVLKFLRFDALHHPEPLFDIGKIQMLYDASIAYNLDLVKKDVGKKFEQHTNSFFMAASVGLNTLLFLEKMEHVPPEVGADKKDYEAPLRNVMFEEISQIVFSGIVPAQVFSMEANCEIEVLYGTPGYMWSLISILHRLGPWKGKN